MCIEHVKISYFTWEPSDSIDSFSSLGREQLIELPPPPVLVSPSVPLMLRRVSFLRGFFVGDKSSKSGADNERISTVDFSSWSWARSSNNSLRQEKKFKIYVSTNNPQIYIIVCYVHITTLHMLCACVSLQFVVVAFHCHPT